MSGADINDAARMVERANDNLAMAIRAAQERFLRDCAWHLHQAADLFERAHYAMARADRAEDAREWAQEAAPIGWTYGRFAVRPIPPVNAYGIPQDFETVLIDAAPEEKGHA